MAESNEIDRSLFQLRCIVKVGKHNHLSAVFLRQGSRKEFFTSEFEQGQHVAVSSGQKILGVVHVREVHSIGVDETDKDYKNLVRDIADFDAIGCILLHLVRKHGKEYRTPGRQDGLVGFQLTTVNDETNVAVGLFLKKAAEIFVQS